MSEEDMKGLKKFKSEEKNKDSNKQQQQKQMPSLQIQGLIVKKQVTNSSKQYHNPVFLQKDQQKNIAETDDLYSLN